MTEHKDITGAPISVGDYIAYSAASGRSAVLKVGIVVELTNGKGDLDGEQIPKVRVITVDHWKHADYIQNNGKPVTLGMLDRIIVISEPGAKFSDLLGKYYAAYTNR